MSGDLRVPFTALFRRDGSPEPEAQAPEPETAPETAPVPAAQETVLPVRAAVAQRWQYSTSLPQRLWASTPRSMQAQRAYAREKGPAADGSMEDLAWREFHVLAAPVRALGLGLAAVHEHPKPAAIAAFGVLAGGEATLAWLGYGAVAVWIAIILAAVGGLNWLVLSALAGRGQSHDEAHH